MSVEWNSFILFEDNFNGVKVFFRNQSIEMYL